VLNRFADPFEADLPAFFTLETPNDGRPIAETSAQISRLPQFCRCFAALPVTRRSDVIPVEGSYLCYTQRVSLGVVGLVTSFNHPLAERRRGICSLHSSRTDLRAPIAHPHPAFGLFHVPGGLPAPTPPSPLGLRLRPRSGRLASWSQ
jgi:Aldehyde dehydrogenase family